MCVHDNTDKQGVGNEVSNKACSEEIAPNVRKIWNSSGNYSRAGSLRIRDLSATKIRMSAGTNLDAKNDDVRADKTPQ
jgi:hypothetical protein